MDEDFRQLRAEFGELLDSMHHQLDVHANQIFDLFVAKFNKRTGDSVENMSGQLQLRQESGSSNVGDVSIPHHSRSTDQSQPVDGQQTGPGHFATPAALGTSYRLAFASYLSSLLLLYNRFAFWSNDYRTCR